MKGMSMAIKVIIIMIVALVVLMILISVAGSSKGSIDITMKRNILFQCCTDRAIWDCGPTGGVVCAVPWEDEFGDKIMSLSALAIDVGLATTESDIKTLQSFCLCGG